MPISPELLQILCCPSSKAPLEVIEPGRLARLNAAIEAGTVLHTDGSQVVEPLAEALVTTDGCTVYRVDDGIPVMLVDQAIPTASVSGW